MRLNELPEEIIIHILSFLPPEESQSTKFISTLFYTLSNDNFLWKRNLQKYFPHHLPPITDEESVNYKKMFGEAMKFDYIFTQRTDFFESKDTPFSTEEIDIFNACKLGKLHLFSNLFEPYIDNLDKFNQLMTLQDQAQRSFIQWAGYFGNQEILDIVFKKMSKAYSENKSTKLYGLNYFHFATMCNQINVLKNASDEELQIITDEGLSILSLSIAFCHIELAQYLVNERNIEITQSTQCRKPIHFAAAFGNVEILQFALSKCEPTQNDIVTMFKASIQCNNSISMEYLLTQSFDANLRASLPHKIGNVIVMGSSKDSALETALRSKRPLLAIMLLKHQNCKANCSLAKHIYRNKYQFSLEMNVALAEQLFKSVKNQYLNENDQYDTSKKDEFGNSIFHWLAYCNQIDTLNSLSNQLENNPNHMKQTPVELAAICRHKNVIQIYLEAGFDINNKYNYQNTLLHIACENGHEELVKYLLSFTGINIDIVNYHSSTPIREACEKGYQNIVSRLLDAGADVNIANLHGVTPLIAAAKHGHVEVLKMLLNHPEIDTDMQVINGSTALDYAERNGHDECVLLLRMHNNSQKSCVLS